MNTSFLYDKGEEEKKMYEILKYVFVGAVAVLGIFMAVCPKYAVKAEDQEDEKSLSGARKRGILLAAVATVCLVFFIIPKVIL